MDYVQTNLKTHVKFEVRRISRFGAISIYSTQLNSSLFKISSPNCLIDLFAAHRQTDTQSDENVHLAEIKKHLHNRIQRLINV